MDDPVFKSKYQKYKYKVKVWEKSFRQINGRIPSKHDIREAPLPIREAYKMYYKLKSSFLEDTLNDVLDEDGFDVSLDGSVNTDANCSGISDLMDAHSMSTIDALPVPDRTDLIDANGTSSKTIATPLFSNIDEIAPITLTNLRNIDENHVLRDFEADPDAIDNSDATMPIGKLNAQAWGTHLNRAQSSSASASPSTSKSKSTSSQEVVRKVVTEKLFRNASFSKRNPRKSLSHNPAMQPNGGPNSGSELSTRELLPDLETILMEKAKKQQELEDAQTANASRTTSATAAVATTSALRTVVDPGWLERCSAANGLAGSTNSTTDLKAVDHSNVQPAKLGLSNMRVSLALPNLESETADSITTGVKEIYAHNTYADDMRDGDDDGDEDVIENSEDETSCVANTSVRHVLKKRKVHDVRPVPIVAQLPAETNVTAKKAPTKSPTSVSRKTTQKPIAKTSKKPSRSASVKKSPKAKTSPKLTSTRPVRRQNARREVCKTSQNATSPTSIVAANHSEDDAAETEATDSDGDPAFNPNTEMLRLRKTRNIKLSGDSDTANDEDDDNEKENPPKSVPNVSRRLRATKQQDTTSSKRKSKAQTMPDEGAVVDDDSDEQVDYNLEFGTDFTQSVPRVNVDELQASTHAFQNYVHSAASGTPKSAVTINAAINVPLTKRELERAKLESKIRSGTLNENYVRVNIEKKKFSRGHKTTNFSKYKKSEWRKTKVANALAGPEMNMRGCDGGFLVCFQCGQQGHFASDCKIQADRLLSLDAVAEVSEFPTLVEVERMAAERALLAHASRPESLPAAASRLRTIDEQQHDEKQVSSSNEDDTPGSETDANAEEYSTRTETIAQDAIKTETAATFIGHRIPDEFLKLSGFDESTVANSDAMQPLYNLQADGTVQAPTAEVMEALRLFGHSAFRKGQDRAVMRVLSGLPTLVTLSTGSGKSLCYQLPAYIFRQHRRQCITLVISPLVSLMEDQVHDVPAFLNAQCLHTNQAKAVRERIMEQIRAGVVDVLLISPEAVVAGEKSTGFGSLLRQLPPIAFVCIDEAHCMSQWSHNFRPSYLMICRVLQEKLKVRTVLGLTATATLPTRESIVRHLAIPDGMQGVISDVPLPNNLLLTVSRDENRDAALVRLLRTEKFAEYQSIIVYCSRRDECERVANLIRTCFQEEEKALHEANAAAADGGAAGKTKKRSRQKSLVECYHAGLQASRRKKIQNEFMRSDLKVVVATIAFGMGINKADIRAVIHFNMPMTYENYTQEVGRAGRDGKTSHCHLFLDPQKKDLVELRRHVYANSIDRHVIRKLLRKVFVSCACQHNLNLKEYQSEVDAVNNMSWTDDMDNDDAASASAAASTAKPSAKPADSATPTIRKCPGHESSFSVEETIQELDIPEQNIETLLCYLELHEQRYIQVLSKAYTRCKVMAYGGPAVLKAVSRTCAPLAMAIALDLKRGISHNESTLIEFCVIDIASAIGWDSGIVKYQLKNLEWTTVNGQPKRSTVSVQFSNLGFRVRSPGDLDDEELDATLDLLHKRVTEQEHTQLLQLQNVFNGLSQVAFKSYAIAVGQPDQADKHSDVLKLHIREYFQRRELDQTVEITNEQGDVTDEQLIGDVRTMMSRYPDNQFTGRTLARIFHGVASPVYPAQIWFRCQYWRQHTRVDFNRIVHLANAEIVKSRT